ncbi:MAG: DUF692 domain-containing protein [bacterium]
MKWLTGLGLRRELIAPLKARNPPSVQFLEIAPENWIGVGGRLSQELLFLRERYPLICHGLSLSLGSTDPLDLAFLKKVKNFLKDHRIDHYSEHLSYASHEGHLYDLLPLPFTEEAVRHVSRRIRRVQELLERKIAVENVSYYLSPPQGEMNEAEFLNAVLEEADCRLLLDVNNVYVNSVNHGYDATEFIQSLPAKRIAYLHLAGHYREKKDLIIDTHGAEVVDPVWKLLEGTYSHHGVFPTLLERDFNLPTLSVLIQELKHVERLQKKARKERRAPR